MTATTETDGVVVYIYPDGTPYFIYWESIRDMRAVLAWIHHLSQKSWFTSQVCNMFVRECAQHLAIDIALP